jgi:large subunit ribosomal protein L3
MNRSMGLLGKKIGMTHMFEEDGTRVPVTVIDVASNVVTAHRTDDRDGYTALQLGYGEQKPSRVNKPDLARFQKAQVTPRRFVRELRVAAAELAAHPVGSTIAPSVFADGELVDVTGTSKGKGYQGVIKRHRMSGEKRSHGQHEFFRHGGSIGCRLTPGRVLKGKRMAGQMGNERVTVQNLRVARVMPEEGVILVRGTVPGASDGYVVVRRAVKARAAG